MNITPPRRSVSPVKSEPKLSANNRGVAVIEVIVAHCTPTATVVVLETPGITTSCHRRRSAYESDVAVSMRLAARESDVFTVTAIMIAPVRAMYKIPLCALASHVVEHDVATTGTARSTCTRV